MKILQINSVCGFGSTGNIVIDIAKMVMEQGHDALIAYGRNGKEHLGIKTLRIGNDYDVYLHGLYTRLMDKTGFASTKATVKFIEDIKHYKPDIIHLHNIHGYYINIEILFNFLGEASIPVVWTLHDCWAFTGHCAHFDYVGCDKWKTGCKGSCPQKKSYPASLFLSNADFNYRKKKELFTSINKMTIVTPSKWLAGLVKESFLQKYPTEVIHNCINTEIFKTTLSDFRQKYAIEGKFIILGVANIWDKRKGFDDFIKLSQMLGDLFHIVLVGLNEKQIEDIKNIKNITGIRRTSNAAELAGLYTTANVFFNPTYEDNYPTVNLEAIACGTPVITYNTGGSPETIYGRTGYIINIGDVKSVSNTIIKLAYMQRNTTPSNLRGRDTFSYYMEIYENSIL